MSFDGIVTRAITYELKCILTESKIYKIYQQEKDEILIRLRKSGQNYKLLISASSNNPRIYLTEHSKKNPSSPPMFCMLMRKHLLGGVITNITQYELDRVICIDIKSMDEMGELSTKHLIVEIMGKYSNIILVDESTNTIIDSIKRVSADMSRIRQVLPGLKYSFPSSGNKINPINISFNTFLNKINNNSKKNIPVFKFFYTSFIGFSPLFSREICYRSSVDERKSLEYLDNDDKKRLFNVFSFLMNEISFNRYTPNIVYHMERDEVLAFHALPLKQYKNMSVEYHPFISHILNKYYYNADLRDRLSQKSQSIKKTIQIKLDRALKKLAKQREELLEAKNREHYKIYGDLISSNIYKISKGMSHIELENFYTENMENITIILDPKLTPGENAQKNYKKYAKLKNASKLLDKQILENKSEIEYLENVLIGIENCTELDELDEIKEELVTEGYIKGNKKKKQNTKSKKSKPHHFVSSDNFHIYVGKNNKQNDYLTLKFAKKDDLWLHTKDIPGSHVIIRTENKKITDDTLYESALLAAFYSKAKNSQNVSVDYTYKKNVKKPNGAKPGMVIYENNSTIFINPLKSEVNKIKKVED